MAIALVIVIAVFLAGLFPGMGGSGKNSSAGSPGTSEWSAAASGTAFAGGVPGGPWSLIAAQGFLSANGQVLNESIFDSRPPPLNCSHPGTVSSVQVPGFNGTYDTGMAEGWLLLYTSTAVSGGAELMLAVVGSSVYDLGELVGGTGCGAILPGVPLSSNLIDSTTAVLAVVETPTGGAFIAANSHASGYFLLHAAADYAYAPLWEVVFHSPCTDGVQDGLSALLYASNGTVINADNQPGVSCSA